MNFDKIYVKNIVLCKNWNHDLNEWIEVFEGRRSEIIWFCRSHKIWFLLMSQLPSLSFSSNEAKSPNFPASRLQLNEPAYLPVSPCVLYLCSCMPMCPLTFMNKTSFDDQQLAMGNDLKYETCKTQNDRFRNLVQLCGFRL